MIATPTATVTAPPPAPQGTGGVISVSATVGGARPHAPVQVASRDGSLVGKPQHAPDVDGLQYPSPLNGSGDPRALPAQGLGPEQREQHGLPGDQRAHRLRPGPRCSGRVHRDRERQHPHVHLRGRLAGGHRRLQRQRLLYRHAMGDRSDRGAVGSLPARTPAAPPDLDSRFVKIAGDKEPGGIASFAGGRSLVGARGCCGTHVGLQLTSFAPFDRLPPAKPSSEIKCSKDCLKRQPGTFPCIGNSSRSGIVSTLSTWISGVSMSAT